MRQFLIATSWLVTTLAVVSAITHVGSGHPVLGGICAAVACFLAWETVRYTGNTRPL